MSESSLTMFSRTQSRELSSPAPIRSTKCWFLVQFTCTTAESETGYGHARSSSNTVVDRVLLCLVDLNQPLQADVSNLESQVIRAFGKEPATTLIEHLHVKDQASKTPWYTTVEQLVVYLRGDNQALWTTQMQRVPNLWGCGGNKVTVGFKIKVWWYTA